MWIKFVLRLNTTDGTNANKMNLMNINNKYICSLFMQKEQQDWIKSRTNNKPDTIKNTPQYWLWYNRQGMWCLS
jgi:predicted MPP superfamily phosphohydrolase